VPTLRSCRHTRATSWSAIALCALFRSPGISSRVAIRLLVVMSQICGPSPPRKPSHLIPPYPSLPPFLHPPFRHIVYASHETCALTKKACPRLGSSNTNTTRISVSYRSLLLGLDGTDGRGEAGGARLGAVVVIPVAVAAVTTAVAAATAATTPAKVSTTATTTAATAAATTTTTTAVVEPLAVTSLAALSPGPGGLATLEVGAVSPEGAELLV
jgi:hypothetical protein